MKTHYYCDSCKVVFIEEDKIPNLNRIHYECGSRIRIIKHTPEKEEEE